MHGHPIPSNVTTTLGNRYGLMQNTYLFNDYCSSHFCSIGVLVSGGKIRWTVNQQSNTGRIKGVDH